MNMKMILLLLGIMAGIYLVIKVVGNEQTVSDVANKSLTTDPEETTSNFSSLASPTFHRSPASIYAEKLTGG